MDLEFDFINSDGKIIKKEELSYISRGSNASVWKYQSVDSLEKLALKIFFPHAHKFSLDLDTYERMRQLPLQNIIKPIDIYYKYNNDVDFEGNFDGYMMPYLEEKRGVLLSEISLDYLIENIVILENDIKILTEYDILMQDIKLENSIICNDNCQLNIIDIDMFSCINNMSFSDIDIYFSSYRTRKFNTFKENMYMLLSLIKAHFIYDVDRLCLSDEKKSEIKSFLYSYFAPCNIGNGLISDRVEGLFQNCDTPKEYFLKR